VGCDTDTFKPIDQRDDRVRSIRESMGVADDELMLLTVGGDAASKGGREAMQALAQLKDEVPKWKYIFTVWPQPRTEVQTRADMQLAVDLGIADRVTFVTSRASRDFMPYLMNACDIYVGPSRLEGFGMPQVEAGACGKPVISINAMAPKETLIHGETALLADVAEVISVNEVYVGPESGFPEGHKVVFDRPRVADYRASVPQLAEHFRTLMNDPDLRQSMGAAGRERVAACFDYRLVARSCVDLLRHHLDIEETETVPNKPILHEELTA
jgi:glycosyltransferase involved in cell wall biosynthesis